MTGEDWYGGWVEMHCEATGADAKARAALLSEVVRRALLDSGRTTTAELGEVTARLVARHDTPKFANEHSDAVGLELVRLREERARASRPDLATETPPDCPACGGSGLAVIPVRACVREGRLYLHRTLKRVVTGAVLCDRPGCEAGRRACEQEAAKRDPPEQGRRPRLTQCEREAGCDLVALMREFERESAKRARASGGESPLAALVAQMLAKVRSGKRDAA